MTKDRAMKRLFFSFTLVAVLILSLSCGDKCQYAKPLLSAEQTVKSRPYDAIVVLEGRKDSLCHTEADSSLYELVYAEALRGHGLQMSDTILLSRSARFFRQQGDDNRTARALLQTALCLFDDGKYIDAATKMKEAEAIAIGLDDPDLHNRLFLALARLNDLAGNDVLSEYYYKLAQTATHDIDSPERKATTLNAVAGHHLRQGNIESFKMCMSLCKPLLDSISDINRAAIEANMGCYQLAKGDTAAAKNIFSRSQLVCPDRKSSLLLGDIYAKEGDNKRASAMWYDATNSTDAHIRKGALGRLIAWAKAHGNMKEAFFLSDLLNNTYEKDITTTTAATIATLQKHYDNQQTERRNKRTALLFAIAGIIIVGVGATLFLVVMHHRTKQKDASFKRWNIEKKLLQADCVHHLHRLAATGKAAQAADWDALHEAVGQHDKALAVLLERCKNLTAVEIGIVMLTRLRFMPSEIATLTTLSPQSVTNTRARLLHKIFGKNGGAKDFDQAIKALT